MQGRSCWILFSGLQIDESVFVVSISRIVFVLTFFHYLTGWIAFSCIVQDLGRI
jgi:hypothetical protein